MVEVSVTDTGIGIAPADCEAVFEEFRQVGTDYTKKSEGTGLGLASRENLWSSTAGTIKVTSVLGKGSTFSFTLPLRNACSDRRRGARRRFEGLAMANETHSDRRRQRKKSQARARHSAIQRLPATRTETAEEGIQLARDNKPALILMDFHLPGMNGIEASRFCALIRRRARYPLLRHSVGHDRGPEKMIAAGFEGLQTQPINVKEFLECVAATLKKHAGAA
jgi:CheY-like chemotaxis protein